MADAAQTMPAAVFLGEGKVALQEVEVPALGAGQVMVEVSYCGICGTDLHMVIDGWGRPGSVLGHEYSGTIVALGPDVEDRSIGDLVVGGPAQGCGRCRWCNENRTNLCAERSGYGEDAAAGAFARFKAIDADCTYLVPVGLDLRAAALAEPTAVALHGVERVPLQAGDRVLVTGAGPIGLLTVSVLRTKGITEVVVSEPAEGRRALAEQLGATAIAPESLERPALATELVRNPFQAAFECSGRAEAMEAALANLDRGGVLVLSGTGMHRPRLDPNRIILHELTVTGAVEYTPVNYRQVLEILSRGQIPTDVLIEADIQPLSAVQSAMEGLAQGALAGKVLVSPDA